MSESLAAAAAPEIEQDARGAALELVRSLQVRESLLKTLLEIERAIAERVPLRHVLDMIIRGAASLLGATSAALGRRDPASPTGAVELAAFRGTDSPDWDLGTVVAVAMAEDEPVTSPSPDLSSLAIAVPVSAGGGTGGYLVATVPADDADPVQQTDHLVALAQQAGLALADARAAEEVRAARHDSLTGLPNRSLFLEQLDARMFEARAWRRELAVLFVDLDGFKAVNDTLGHGAGDELLGVVGRRLQHCLRPSDVVARLGGDEFAVLAEKTDTEGCESLARRLIDSLQQPVGVAGREVFVSASIGIARTGAGPATATELLSNADVAMYQAKRRGPGQVAHFDPRVRQESARQLQLRSELERALEQGQLSVQFQPATALDSGRVDAVEALLRWEHPELGCLSVTLTESALLDDDAGAADRLRRLRDLGMRVALDHLAGRLTALQPTPAE